PVEVGFERLAAIRGQDFECGSVIAVELRDATGPDGSASVSATLRVVRPSSVSPASSVDLLLVDIQGPDSVGVDIPVGWEDADLFQFQTTLAVSGQEGRFGFLLNCPVTRLRVGSFEDQTAAGATIRSSGETVPAPSELGGDALDCPSIVRLRLQESMSD